MVTWADKKIQGATRPPSSNSPQRVAPFIERCGQIQFYQVHDLLAHGVVTSRIVVGFFLLAADHLLGVEELSTGLGPDLIHHRGLEVKKHCPGHMMPAPVSLKKVEKLSSPPPAAGRLVTTMQLRSFCEESEEFDNGLALPYLVILFVIDIVGIWS